MSSFEDEELPKSAREQRNIAHELRKPAPEQEKLAREQGKLGREQGKLGRELGKLARQPLIPMQDQALHLAKAQTRVSVPHHPAYHLD